MMANKYIRTCTYIQVIKQERVYIQGQLKLTHINFAILNRHVTVIYLTFIKSIRKIENNFIDSFIKNNLIYYFRVEIYFMAK